MNSPVNAQINSTTQIQGNTQGYPAGIRSTASTLQNDPLIQQQLAAFLGNSGQLSGLRDLLNLNELRAAVDKLAPTKGEKPLLISDYITSSINCRYSTDPQEVELNDTTKLTIEGKHKKPEVSEYTTELWSAANCRIIRHLLKTGATYKTLLEYVVYSGWISEYLEMYVQKGVFL